MEGVTVDVLVKVVVVGVVTVEVEVVSDVADKAIDVVDERFVQSEVIVDEGLDVWLLGPVWLGTLTENSAIPDAMAIPATMRAETRLSMVIRSLNGSVPISGAVRMLWFCHSGIAKIGRPENTHSQRNAS